MILNDFSVSAASPSTVGGIGAVVKYFPRLQPSFSSAFPSPSATNAAGQLAVPGGGVLDGRWFDVLVGGFITSGVADSSVTVESALYANTGSVSVPVYTKLATTGTLTALLTNTSYNFSLKVSLFGGGTSGVVRGFQQGTFGANNIASASLTNNLSNINFGTQSLSSPFGVQAQPPFGLVVGVTFGSSDAFNKAALTQFQIAAS